MWQCTILCKVTQLWQKWQKIVKRQKILTIIPQNCETNVTKLRRYIKKVARIFLISWLCTIFWFSIILWCFFHKIVSSNVQVLSFPPYETLLDPFKDFYQILASFIDGSNCCQNEQSRCKNPFPMLNVFFCCFFFKFYGKNSK